MANNSKDKDNELYKDFVDMVNKVSKAVTKETSKPIADNIKTVSTEMNKASQALQKTSTEIERLTSAKLSEIANQTQETTKILKKTSDEIGSVASDTIIKAIAPLNSEIQNTTSILKQTSDNIGPTSTKAIQKGIEPLTGQIKNTTNLLKTATDEISEQAKEVTKILKKTSDEIGDVASQAIQNSLFPIQHKMEVSSSAMTRASSNIASLYNNVATIRLSINKIFEENKKVGSSIDSSSKETNQKIDSILASMNQENNELKVQLSTVSKSIQSNLATHLNNSLVKSFNYIRQDNEALREQNRLLSNEIQILKNNQHRFNILLFSIMFLVILSGVLILGALAMIFKGMI